MGRISDIMDSFKTHKALIDIPAAWRIVLASFPKATCWYPAQISSQVCLNQLMTALCRMSCTRLPVPAAVLASSPSRSHPTHCAGLSLPRRKSPSGTAPVHLNLDQANLPVWLGNAQ